MSDGKIVQLKRPDDKNVDPILVEFLEAQLERAKAGEIDQFMCISQNNSDSKYMTRLYARPNKKFWIEALGFVEMINQEVIRIRSMIEETFNGER